MNNNHALTVLVTRPEPFGKKLCDQLTSHGDHPIYLPTIAFQPTEKTALHASLKNINEMDCLIFVSQAAVSVFASCNITLKKSVKIAAVGVATAAMLTDAGYENVICPENDTGSEALLDLKLFHQVTNKKIMLMRGDAGRTLIANTLKKRGATVTHCILYHRILPTVSHQTVSDKITSTPIHAILATSFECIANLKRMLGSAHHDFIKQTPFFVMSDRIKTLAHELGCEQVFASKHASTESLLALLEEHRKSLCKTNMK